LNINNKLIFDIEETDEEVLFKFKANSFDIITEYINPKTYCAERSPWSVKNLPRENKKYAIPTEDLTLYKEITASIPKDNISIYNIINNGFLVKLSTKKRKPIDTLKNEIKMGGWQFKSYIHSLGKDVWSSYLNYIKNYLSKI
jgi:hypothetical protein